MSGEFVDMGGVRWIGFTLCLLFGLSQKISEIDMPILFSSKTQTNVFLNDLSYKTMFL